MLLGLLASAALAGCSSIGGVAEASTDRFPPEATPRPPQSIPFVDGCQNPRKDGAAKKVGMALAFISAAPCSRTLGGKRWLGDKPCQGRQPPEAGAAGPPLQGLPPSHTRPPRSTADPRDAASSAIYARIHAADNTVGDKGLRDGKEGGAQATALETCKRGPTAEHQSGRSRRAKISRADTRAPPSKLRGSASKFVSKCPARRNVFAMSVDVYRVG